MEMVPLLQTKKQPKKNPGNFSTTQKNRTEAIKVEPWQFLQLGKLDMQQCTSSTITAVQKETEVAISTRQTFYQTKK